MSVCSECFNNQHTDFTKSSWADPTRVDLLNECGTNELLITCWSIGRFFCVPDRSYAHRPRYRFGTCLQGSLSQKRVLSANTHNPLRLTLCTGFMARFAHDEALGVDTPVGQYGDAFVLPRNGLYPRNVWFESVGPLHPFTPSGWLIYTPP